MPLRLPRRDDRPSLLARLAAVVVGVVLLAGSPVAAATLLQNASATPATGTTDTTFVLSVDYVSDPEARPAESISVEIVGLGVNPLPMPLVAGDVTNGTWQTSTMLPAGTWDLIFRAQAAGSDPPPVGIVVIVVDAATPTPSPSPVPGTPAPSLTPSPVPTATGAGSPPPTSVPTPVPTPLPPGVAPSPAPTLTPPPASSPRASQGGSASASALPSGGQSERPAASERPARTTSATRSAAPSPGTDEGRNDGPGWGRAGWIVLGGLTSAAGAAVLARQWLVRRAAAGP